MVESLEFVASTVAVVYGPQFQPKSPVSAQALGEVLQRPTANLAPDGSVVITSHRDQVEVILSGPKVDFRDVSGSHEKSHEKIPSVLHGICPLVSDSSPISFGVNFIVSVPKDNPSAWIAQKFLNNELNSIIHTPLESAGVSLIYDQDGKRVIVRFDPGPDSSVMINFNASEEITKLPGHEQLATDIKSLRKALLDFLDALEM
jgi:hypothetical protein